MDDAQTGLKNVHTVIPVAEVLALDLMAMVKTEIGPARWSRTAVIRDAIREYMELHKIGGDAGSYRIVDVTDTEESECVIVGAEEST